MGKTLGAIGELESRVGIAGRSAWQIQRGFYEVIRRQASAAGVL